MDFKDLVADVRKEWPADVESVYESASEAFGAEVAVAKVFGAEVRAARHDSGLTQMELCARVDLQQSELSRIENGLGNPTLATMVRLAKVLHLKSLPLAV